MLSTEDNKPEKNKGVDPVLKQGYPMVGKISF